MTKLFTIIIFVFSTIAVCAQNNDLELIGDRPDMTESAYTIPKGHIQIESGFDYSKETSEINSITFNTTLLRYGLFDNAELRLGMEFVSNTFNGVSSSAMPMYLGSKIHILDKEKHGTQIAIIIASGAEKFDSGLGDVEYDFTPNFILAFENDLTSNISLGYNAGLEHSTLSSTLNLFLSSSLGIGLGSNDGVFVELAWITNNVSNDIRFNSGFTHLFTDNIQMDIYGGLGLTNDSPIFNAGVGFIFLF